MLRAFHLQLQTCLPEWCPLTLAALAMFPRAPGAVSFPCFSHAVGLMLLSCCSPAVILMTLHLQTPDSVLSRFSWEVIATSVGITSPFSLPTHLLLVYISGGTKLISHPACDTHNIKWFQAITFEWVPITIISLLWQKHYRAAWREVQKRMLSEDPLPIFFNGPCGRALPFLSLSQSL